MIRLLIVTGSRADAGILEWPTHVLKADDCFDVVELSLWNSTPWTAGAKMEAAINASQPDMVVLVGDRFEIMTAALAAHLARVPIAHLCGGDRTLGSYDDAMRDSISRMATLHFAASSASARRLSMELGYTHVFLVGNPEIDYVMRTDWKRARPYPEPYTVVSYQPQTYDGQDQWGEVVEAIQTTKVIFMAPNPDRGSPVLQCKMAAHATTLPDAEFHECMPHPEFLNLLAHCEEFIGNSSAIFYLCPFLGVKTRMFGTRQDGRVIPFADGRASERIAHHIKAYFA